jgi:hypothetical protein
MKTLYWTLRVAVLLLVAIALACQSPEDSGTIDTLIVPDSIPTTKDTVAAPSFSPAPGHYTLDSGALQSIALTTATQNAQIYYSFSNALEPDSFLKVPASGYITIAKSTTILTYATKESLINSPITTGVYTLSFKQSQPLQGSITISGMLTVSKNEDWTNLKVGLFEHKGLDAWPGGNDSEPGYMWLNDLNDSEVKTIAPLELARIEGSSTPNTRPYSITLPSPDTIGNNSYCLIAWIDENQDSAWSGIDKGFQYTGAHSLSEYNVLAKHTITQSVNVAEPISYPEARVKFFRKTYTALPSWGIDAYAYAQGQNKNWAAKSLKEDGSSGFNFFVSPIVK